MAAGFVLAARSISIGADLPGFLRPTPNLGAFRVLLAMADEVLPVEESDVLRAREVLKIEASLSGLEALHLAVLRRRGVKRVLSFDADFMRRPGIERMWRL